MLLSPIDIPQPASVDKTLKGKSLEVDSVKIPLIVSSASALALELALGLATDSVTELATGLATGLELGLADSSALPCHPTLMPDHQQPVT